MAEQRYNDALLSLKEYVAREPESVLARALLGETYLELGQLMDARRHLKIALDKQARYVPTLVLLARVELQSGQYEMALEYASRIQKVQPELFVGYELAGDAWMQMNSYAEARAAYAQAWDRKPSAELVIKLSEAASRTGQHEEAISILRAWLAEHTEDARVQQFLGATYLNMEQNDMATRHYEKVLETEPDNVVALNNLAWLYSLDREPRALVLAERAYHVSPDDPGIQDTYGWALIQQGEVDKGRRLLHRAVRQLPDNTEIMYHYAVALLKSGKQQEGRRILTSLLKDGQSFEGRAEAKALLAE
jgi:putative PEP-CTERM system TPR-repeat lipoprotein